MSEPARIALLTKRAGHSCQAERRVRAASSSGCLGPSQARELHARSHLWLDVERGQPQSSLWRRKEARHEAVFGVKMGQVSDNAPPPESRAVSRSHILWTAGVPVLKGNETRMGPIVKAVTPDDASR